MRCALRVDALIRCFFLCCVAATNRKENFGVVYSISYHSSCVSSTHASCIESKSHWMRYVARSMDIYWLRDGTQNTLLFHDIEFGRAKVKGIRISCPRSSTDYVGTIKTHCFSVILNPGGLKWKLLESHRLSAHVMHIYSLPDGIQNILLSQQIQNARAILKSTRISWAAPSTHYRRAIKTYCFPSKSRMRGLKWNALESPTRSPSDLHLHLLIT